MKATAAILAGLMAVSVANAFDPTGLWHDPARDGVGVYITADTGFGHAVMLNAYRRDGSSAHLSAGENCPGLPCVVPLHEPTANWMGGGLDLGEPVAIVELHQAGDGIQLQWDVRDWDVENCTGISPGGVIFRECVGTLNLQILAR